MYAVIVTGGKQYRVEEGQVLKIEKLPHEIGANFDFEQVLMVADGDSINVGTPVVTNAKVSAEVLAQDRAKKVEILKFKRRKHHMKRMGHRQSYTQVKITGISAGGAKAKAKAKPAAKEQKAEE